MSQTGKYFEGTASPDVETLTGNSGGVVGADAAFNINLLGRGTQNIIGSPGANTLYVQQPDIASYIVSNVVNDYNANYTTIQAAINAAHAAGASSTAQIPVFIRQSPTTYTENLTLYDGILLIGYTEVPVNDFAVTANYTVAIVGNHTIDNSANVQIQNVLMGNSNGTLFTGGANSSLTLMNVYAIAASSGIMFDAGGNVFRIYGNNCYLLSSTGTKLFSESVQMSLAFNDSTIGATGNRSTSNSQIRIFLESCTFGLEIDASSSSSLQFEARNCLIENTTGNPIITGGAGAGGDLHFYFCRFTSTGGTLFNMGAANALNMYKCQFDTSAIATGSYTLNLFDCNTTGVPTTVSSISSYFDTSTGNLNLSTPLPVLSGGRLIETAVSGTTQSMAVNVYYRCTNGALTTLTLPTTAALQSRIRVLGVGAGLFKIAQNASQTIAYLGSTTTSGVGGNISSSQANSSVELECTTANTGWTVIDSQGTYTVT